ncbi:Sir2 family NAD-dependent protein deacetylase [Leucobacter sp. UT-8R-CII-1-4]|uniref:Sir2 family NAD-dependent protein deacetylase n=1 Tax=Leucobacter sp. UT-8R-CII-1-4 TaxID=3040075 RepID=UPI0024A92D61|nr:Sir2 family NAD-dependent protein deacetylase [Leucobacter sp. UT-8R-CII-1-4]MDI6022773.1 Sir2 family NAD-dependent protein deacetylase [Leucobacter sp. UT-8R-CII-1-4]
MHEADRLQSEIISLSGLFELGPAALLTGAGVSTDSGIPDYRGAGTPPRTPMSIAQFTGDDAYRRRFWAGARVGALGLSGVQPNAGHRAIATLERDGRLSGVITQNVDGLHAAAGTSNLAELHGNGATIRCVPEGHRFSRAEVLTWFDVANPGFADRNAGAKITPDGDADVSDTAGVRVPVCPACGGMLRPDVVYFGEHVPVDVFAHAERIVAAASSLIVAGSSLAVNTGIRLVHRAEQRGLPIAVINRGATQIDQRDSVKVRIDGGASEVFMALTERLGA